MHGVSLCVREPQTAPQSPRIGGYRFEKTGCWIDPQTEAATPKVFPDPSHGKGGVMTSPEVTWQRDRKSMKNTLY